MSVITTMQPEQIICLPGAAGDRQQWVAALKHLNSPLPAHHVGWPGFTGEPSDPHVNSLSDLSERVVLPLLDRPSIVLAHSMGGVVACLAALQRPQQITHLVLAVTSGGLDLSPYGAEDWRTTYQTAHPEWPHWFCQPTHQLGINWSELTMPTLLLWAGSDPYSPVAVGQALQQRIPRAHLRVADDAGHDLVRSHAQWTAQHIREHLYATQGAFL